MGSSFWRALAEGDDEDLGFIHFSAVGHAGRSPKPQDGFRPAFLDITCGLIDIYVKSNPESETFDDTILHLDFMYTDPRQGRRELDVLRELEGVKSASGDEVCLKLKRDLDHLTIGPAFFVFEWFCSDYDTIDKLRAAIDLQIKRSDTKSVTDACAVASKADDAAVEHLEQEGWSRTRQIIKAPDALRRDTTWLRSENSRDQSSWTPKRSPPKHESEVQSPKMRFLQAMGSLYPDEVKKKRRSAGASTAKRLIEKAKRSNILKAPHKRRAPVQPSQMREAAADSTVNDFDFGLLAPFG